MDRARSSSRFFIIVPTGSRIKFVDDMSVLTLKKFLLQYLTVISMAVVIESRRNRAKNNNDIGLKFPGNVKNASEPSRRRAEVAQHRKLPPESSLPQPDVFLALVNNLSLVEYNRNAIDQWNFESNITEPTRLAARSVWRAAMQYEWRKFNESTGWRRQFEMLAVLGVAALSDDKFRRLDRLVNEMETIYGTATILPYKKPTKLTTKSKSTAGKSSVHRHKIGRTILAKIKSGKKYRKRKSKKKPTEKLRLEPELLEIMATSEDPEELLYVWKAWRDATGKRMRKKYVEYVGLMKEVALLNGFMTAGKYWTSAYDDTDLEGTIEQLWNEVKPLYLQLHAYVRNRVRAKYGAKRVPKNSNYIPAHLLGDMWAQSWIHVRRFALPYPEINGTDLTGALVKKKYTPLKFFKLAEDFFHSIGFPWLPETFWKNSILERPEDNREMVCHGSAWDMYDGKDFRIKMCTRVTYEDLVIVHHEMGHVHYYIQYKDQPVVFREGANPGFHEAIGDTIALSVSSPPHTSRLGLTETVTYDTRSDINFLFVMALQKVAFIPFAYCVDKWRWIVFGNDTVPESYNGLWWQLRADIQGIEPPIDRTKDDFDPGSKYHIAASVPYIRYFVSFIIQFQFLEAACLASGRYEPGNVQRPLYRCDLYGSYEGGLGLRPRANLHGEVDSYSDSAVETGELLALPVENRQMMKLGSSKSWPDAMERFTGSRTMQTKGLLAYFRPLYLWLQEENRRSGEPVKANPPAYPTPLPSLAWQWNTFYRPSRSPLTCRTCRGSCAR